MTEKDIQKQIVEYLNKTGKVYAWNDRQVVGRPGKGTFHSSNGVSDILAVGPGGIFIAIEVKRRGGHLQPKQLAFLERVSRVGAIAMVATSLDQVIEELKEVLQSSYT